MLKLEESLAQLLQAQENIQLESAVTNFALRQESGTGRYKSLIPLEQAKEGQQYRFEVDLDECTGCKSCVSACQSLNGLDSSEAWRKVGSLEQVLPGKRAFSQTITGSCHHCLEPACSLGCPVQAYEKDPVTGIVRHLDDQCIGCQYCLMMCPYDVPVYNSRLGIVRKCDMCESRLEKGEAPACAQACPTDAIQIGIVDQIQLWNQEFLPAAADPKLTTPSTLYKKKEKLPRDAQSSAHLRLQAADSHQALVWMLLLSQAGVGMLLWESLAVAFGIYPARFNALFAAGLVALALALATLHLGQPRKAWRFFLGLRSSWMSREILAFNAFMLTAFYCATQMELTQRNWSFGKSALLLSGILGVVCSGMIYIKTRRSNWSLFPCVVRFGGSTLLLGLFASLLVYHLDNPSSSEIGLPLEKFAVSIILVLLLIKCGLEAQPYLVLFREFAEVPRSLRLQIQGLRYWTWARWLAASVCAAALVAVWQNAASTGVLLVAALSCFIGEFCERSLFFRGTVSLNMPRH